MLSRTLSSSFYEMLDALFLWVDSVEKESLVAMARRRCFFCSINEFLFFLSLECGQIFCIHMINSISVVMEYCLMAGGCDSRVMRSLV